MIETAVLTPLGWVASPLIKMLFDRAYDLLDTSRDEQRKILEATVLPRLSLAIQKAERSPNKDALQAWLQRLKDAYYKAEEAIDLFEYERLEKQVNTDTKTLMQKMTTKAGRLINNTSKIKLKRCIDKLIEIANGATEFCEFLVASPENATTRNRETISEHLGRLFGREKDKETIANLLREEPLISEPGQSTRSATSIIAITGRCGIGKTILAQSVYTNMKEQKCFDIFSWVHAPRNFNASEVVEKIVQNTKATDGALFEANYGHFVPLEALKEQMKATLGSKKVLLVLDDFWCDAEDEREQWEKFICCLSGWSPKSKILLTTQNEGAVKQADLPGVTEIKTYLLEELENGRFFELFMHHAWPSNYNIPREDFENIGRKIASKMKGDPGAAKIVGHQLRKNVPDILHWEDIAKKDWLGDSMKARIWSYQQLPVHLQRCFAFCCLFPKGSSILGHLLIQIWMAEGCIKPINKEERMEDIGENYLNELVCRFFLERHVDDGESIYYQLHDLFHDLGQEVQGDEFLRIESPNSNNAPLDRIQVLSQSENIRHIHLPVSTINKLEDIICPMKNLRTLICIGTIPKEVLQNILEKTKKLRVLYLKKYGDIDLPDCLGNLKHLRFLCLEGPQPLKKLPDSICKLYLLQWLGLSISCQSLPKEFCKLVSLRSIDFFGETQPIISDVGKLTSLQFLQKFYVRKDSGHELHQLENLNQLGRNLCITGLENVANIEDAVKANMPSKSRLVGFKFEWNSNERVIDDFQLLDTLQPHPNIRFLTINKFRGNRFPSWLLGQNSLKHLSALRLLDCTNVEEISFFYKSIPNCKVLYLAGLNNLKEMPHLYPSLTTLIVQMVPLLTYFSENDLNEERKQFMLEAVKQITEYVKLRCDLKLPESFEDAIRRDLELTKLRLKATPEISITSSKCENLYPDVADIDPWNKDYTCDHLLDVWNMCMRWHIETMVSKIEESKLILPSSLTKLWILSCSITTDALSASIQCLVSLSELWLCEIQTITSLPSEEALCALKNLRSFWIERCYLLSSLGGIRALTSLTEFQLEYSLNLNSSNGQLPSSLETLKFKECACVDAILDQSDLPLLRVLVVEECLNVGCFREKHDKRVLHVGRVPCLKELTIIGWKGRLEGLNSLTSLNKLEVVRDLSFPTGKCSIQAPSVKVYNPLILKQLSDKTISLTEYMEIVSFEGDSINDEVFLPFTSLKCLGFEDCNITHLPVHLKNLTSLQGLYLNCPNLREVESLPKNLRSLLIKNNPTLAKKFHCHNGGSYQVMGDEGNTYVKFPTEGQTMPGPFQPNQQVSTSQSDQQLAANPREGLTRRFLRLLRN
ncbi:hypothetical protein LUZ61_007954 [Rhynchospora tenuis]|uniref:NB-ARC domain-containing protein n=1 Tax=Rhynchospora tenuis TaxID=198213 RepID=A0AAD5ZUM8_9POAL|nr:hypothetical protein LUZ61_007954 [Rhynchospora tenuis]